jgi:hypothetical protein
MKFKDPIQPKKRTASKDFVAPTRDQATTGRFMQAGDNYGTGFNQPVGSTKVSSKPAMPMKAFHFSAESINHD